MSLERLIEIQRALDRRKHTHKLDYYQPYEYQKKWHNAVGYKTQYPAVEKALICANQIGKTFCAGFEVAMHLTGRYPDWYEGIRFRGPVHWGVGGVTNETVRDICQKELFGDPSDDKQLGTGTIPIDCIGKRTRKPGVGDAFENVRIRHKSGLWSQVSFKCYEQGPKKFMGSRWDGAWLDEEPPPEILSQVRRSTLSRNQKVILLTMTPEEGMTQVVHQFLNNLQVGQAIVTATWDDAPHMTKERKEQELARIPEHEREMRSQGTPFAGAGIVFPVSDAQVLVDPFEIPRHFRRIIGIDFGWDHPFAAAQIAFDADKDTIYLVSEYHTQKQTPPIHAAAIKPWGEWIPIVWPADGLQTEKGAGTPLALQYRTQGLYLLPHHFTNPPSPGEEEGRGGIAVEPGLIEMLTRMQTGRFKVFRTCQQFMTEKRTYHRDEHGKVVKLMDDVISAARYATMSLRHARTKPVIRRHGSMAVGMTNW